MRCAPFRVISPFFMAVASLGTPAAGAATAADPFNFPARINAPPGQFAVSAPVTVSGIDPARPVSVAVYNGEVSIGCTGMFQGNFLPLPTAANGDVFCVRHLSSTQPGGVVLTALYLTSGNDPYAVLPTWGAFLSNTGSVFDTAPDPIVFPRPVRVDVRRNVVQTAAARVHGLSAPAPISVTNGDYAVHRVNGAIPSARQPDVYPHDVVEVANYAAPAWNVTTTTVLTVGGVSTPFVTRTLPRRKLIEGELIDFNGDDLGDVIENWGSTRVYIRVWPQVPLGWIDGDFLNWRITHFGDFDGDGRSDVVWRNAATGATGVWLMNGTQPHAAANVVTDGAWRATHGADFDGDGRTDLVWINDSTGETVLWLVSALGFHDSATLLIHPEWRVELTADMNGDGKSDLVWRNKATGATAVWFMDGKTYLGGRLLVANADWRAVHKGDFDDDGKEDLAWYNVVSGRTAIWLMDGVTLPFKSGVVLTAPIGWPPLAVADFDGDGHSDLLFEDPATGALWISFRDGLESRDAIKIADAPLAFGGILDEDADGAADVVLETANPDRCVVRGVYWAVDRTCPFAYQARPSGDAATRAANR